MSIKDNNRRIASNTFFLYFRMLLTMIVGLYASRVVLKTLGISDYGLYNVVGGVVAMFGFLNGTLQSSTQRFLNYEIGKNDSIKIKTVFSTAMLQHTLLIIIVLFFAETIGLWFICNKLNIEKGREIAAVWVYQFSIIAACVQIIQLPFMSTIIAHERMGVYAYVSIYEVIMKLVIVFLIQLINFDKLILYGFLYLIVQISVAFIYNFYCQKKFQEARFHIIYDKKIFKEMLSFSGWNIIGCLASVCNAQGINILFNLFCGTFINAARALAFQINGMVMQFSNNFQIAVKPQVVKYYAENKLGETAKLVIDSARYSALMLLFLAIPIFIEINFILHIWLGVYPDYAPAFIRIILFQSIIVSMTTSVIMIVHATGKLKEIGIMAGGVNLLILPISYFLLKLGLDPIIVLIVNLLAPFLETFIELYWMKKYINFPMLLFYKKVYGMVFPLGLLMFIIPYIVHLLLIDVSVVTRVIVVTFTSFITSFLVIYQFGLGQTMKIILKEKIKEFSYKLKIQYFSQNK